MFEKPRRKISRVFIHCSASDVKSHDSVATIRRWHLARGFSDIGYHYVILKDGRIRSGRGLERTPAAQKGHNKASIAICVTGLELFSAEQMLALLILCMSIDQVYDGAVTFHGHNEVNPAKSCPVFNYRAVLRLTQSGHMQRGIDKGTVEGGI